MAYDYKCDQIILHDAGKSRDELWIFEMATKHWKKMRPAVLVPKDAAPPVCSREAVYIPEEDVFLTWGSNSESESPSHAWAYKVDENAWSRVDIPWNSGAESVQGVNQNRAMVYDPKRGLVLLVLGAGGDEGKAPVYALKYHHIKAP